MAADKDRAFAIIRQTLASETRQFLAALRKDWPGERLYGFRYEIHSQSVWATAAAATEEGLQRVAARYSAKHKATELAAATKWNRVALRWAGPEDGWYTGQPEKLFERSARLFTEAEQHGWIEAFDGQLETLCLQTLRELDATGLFGKGADRDSVVLGLCGEGGDSSDEQEFEWAAAVNPPAVAERFRQEVAERPSAWQELERLSRTG